MDAAFEVHMLNEQGKEKGATDRDDVRWFAFVCAQRRGRESRSEHAGTP